MGRVSLLIALATLTGCRPPAVAQAPAATGGASPSPAFPEPGVYVLQRVRGAALPADLKPSGSYQPAGGYTSFERVLGGWLYLTPDSLYRTVTCADLVYSTGQPPETMDRQGEGRYWVAGGRTYFSVLVLDGPSDSSLVRLHGDTLELGRDAYVRDRTRVPPRSVIAARACQPVRASTRTSKAKP